MWKSFRCTKETGRSNYMGFHRNYDNMLTFLLADPGGKYKSYNELVMINSNAFVEQYELIRQRVGELKTKRPVSSEPPTNGQSRRTTVQGLVRRIRLVEPRELLNLLNYIETHDTRFMYVPRPFHRSNVFSLTTLVRLNGSSVIGCIFCGKQASYALSHKTACFTTLSLVNTEHVDEHRSSYSTLSFSVPWSDIVDTLYNNDLDPDHQQLNIKPVFKHVHHLHHQCCPVIWLHDDNNATWNCKDAAFTVRGVSRFQHMMRFITTYPRPKETWMWLTLANKLAHCVSPGASQNTLENLLRIICNERLKVLSEHQYDDLVDGLWVQARALKHETRHTLPNHRTLQNDSGPELCLRDPAASVPSTEVVRYENNLLRPLATPRTDTTENIYYSPNSDALNEPLDRLFYRETMHVNSYVYEMIDLSDENSVFDYEYGYQLAELVAPDVLPYGGSSTVIPILGEEPLSVRINSLKANKSKVRNIQRQTVNCCDGAENDTISAFKDGTVSSLNFYRLLFLQGYLITRKQPDDRASFETVSKADKIQSLISRTHVCLYCCAIFTNVLQNYESFNTYFAPYRADRLLKYALYGCNDKMKRQQVYGRILTPHARFPAVFFKDLSCRVISRRLKRHHNQDRRLKGALLWLSSTLDSLHREDCLFRIQKRVYDCGECRICLEECDELDKRVMTCGHWFCHNCYNEIALTDCCLCKNGFRTSSIAVSDTVSSGYAENSHFCQEFA